MYIPLLHSSSALINSPLAMGRPPSQESITSVPDSLFSKLSETSETGTLITEPGLTSTDALVRDSHSKWDSEENLPAFLFDSASSPSCELKRPTVVPR